MKLLLGVVVISVCAFFPFAAQSADSSRINKQARADVDANRHVMGEPRPPWSAIGRVNSRRGGFCSGTLIETDKVLTSAQCLWDREMRNWVGADDLHFLSGYHLGHYIVHRPVAAVEFPAGIRMAPRGVPRNPKNDWAVLTLSRPIPPSALLRPIKRFGPSRPRGVKALGPLVRAGYSSYRPHVLTARHCNAIGFFSPALLMHTCDALNGDSGAPVLVRTTSGWRLLGVQMGTRKRTTAPNGVGIAVLVTAMSARARSRRRD